MTKLVGIAATTTAKHQSQQSAAIGAKVRKLEAPDTAVLQRNLPPELTRAATVVATASPPADLNIPVIKSSNTSVKRGRVVPRRGRIRAVLRRRGLPHAGTSFSRMLCVEYGSKTSVCQLARGFVHSIVACVLFFKGVILQTWKPVSRIGHIKCMDESRIFQNSTTSSVLKF